MIAKMHPWVPKKRGYGTVMALILAARFVPNKDADGDSIQLVLAMALGLLRRFIAEYRIITTNSLNLRTLGK
jgi:hypothetical protein